MSKWNPNKEVAIEEATKEQLEERIADAIDQLEILLKYGADANKMYVKAAISILQTGFPF